MYIRIITKNASGMCDFCDGFKPTLSFNDEERGYEGYNVNFEICPKCFEYLMSVLKDDKDYTYHEIHKLGIE